MPLKRRRSRHRRDAWEWEHRHALRWGHDHFDKFSRYGGAWNMDTARACWADVGEERLAEFVETQPGTRPFAWWHFERGLRFLEALLIQPEEQARYLRRHRLLTADERRSLEARDAA